MLHLSAGERAPAIRAGAAATHAKNLGLSFGPLQETTPGIRSPYEQPMARL